MKKWWVNESGWIIDLSRFYELWAATTGIYGSMDSELIQFKIEDCEDFECSKERLKEMRKFLKSNLHYIDIYNKGFDD